SFVSFVTTISIFGVCLGVAALVVVMAVMEGFETTLRSLITGTHSHVIFYSTKQILPNPEELQKRLRQEFPQITDISSYVFSEVMLAHEGRVVGSMIEGINAEDSKKTTN